MQAGRRGKSSGASESSVKFSKTLAVEASYIGNRGAWWEADGMINVNAMPPQYLLNKGIDVNNATDRALLTKPMTNPDVIARGFKQPYAGFPMTATLAQALRPFPQFAASASGTPAINYLWAPLGRTWYDSLQIKMTKRYSHGLDLSSGFTWQKELVMGNSRSGSAKTSCAVGEGASMGAMALTGAQQADRRRRRGAPCRPHGVAFPLRWRARC